VKLCLMMLCVKRQLLTTGKGDAFGASRSDAYTGCGKC